MDLYSTYSLNRVIVPRLRTMPKLFLTMFPEVVQSDKEEILYDITKTKRPGVTPFVHPMAQGRVIEGAGYSTRSIKPGYLKDLRIHTPHQALKRRAGEALGGSLTQEQRMQAAIAADIQDQLDIFQNRLEVMAAEAVIFGRQTIKGKGLDAVVDFQKSAASKTALTGTARWNDPDMTVEKLFDQLEELAEDMRNRIGQTPDYFLLDPKAGALLKKLMRASDKGGAKYLDRQNKGYDRVQIDLTPSMAGTMGLMSLGSFGDIPLFTFQSEYVDPEDGQLKKVMPDFTVLMIARSRFEGVRHFGAIQSMDPQTEAFVLNPMEYFASSWTEKNPASRILQLESAPLMAPYYPDAVQTITVV